MGRTLLLSLWLPLAVAAQAFLRFGFSGMHGMHGPFGFSGMHGPSMSGPWMHGPMMAAAIVPLLVFAWPAGIPLTMAVRRLYQRDHVAAYGCAAVLGPLTAAAATVGGLLGPVAVWIYAAILSLPAWFVLWLLQRQERRPTP